MPGGAAQVPAPRPAAHFVGASVFSQLTFPHSGVKKQEASPAFTLYPSPRNGPAVPLGILSAETMTAGVRGVASSGKDNSATENFLPRSGPQAELVPSSQQQVL